MNFCKTGILQVSKRGISDTFYTMHYHEAKTVARQSGTYALRKTSTQNWLSKF